MSSEKSKKRIRGEPAYWDELKKTRTMTLTDTAWNELKIKGGEIGVSRSEIIEMWTRGKV